MGRVAWPAILLHGLLVGALLWMAARLGLILLLAEGDAAAAFATSLPIRIAGLLALAGLVAWGVVAWRRSGRRRSAFAVDFVVLALVASVFLPLLIIDAAPFVTVALAAAAILAVGLTPEGAPPEPD